MTDTPAAPTTPRKALEIAEFHHQQHRDITAIQSWQDCTAWPCRAVAEVRSTPAEARLPFAPETERIVRQTLAIVDQITPLSVGEPLVQRILARLRSPEGDR